MVSQPVDAAASVVEERLAELVSIHDPATSDAHAFFEAQFDLGLAWVHFPEGHGGLGVSPRFQAIIDQRLTALGAPSNFARNGIGVGMAAPIIEAFGSEADKTRFLRPLFSCAEIWCQLFSEPGAGSDVASLATSAQRDGDEWVVNGQKVWTTLAHVARWGLLLARTDPTLPKHKGLTYFIVDMHAPGVVVRPLRQITGEAEFNEVFFTDVRVPDSRRLGAVGEGWRVAITTLMNERNAVAADTARGEAGPIDRALALWHRRAGVDPVTRDRLVRLWVESEVVRLTTWRAQQMRAAGTPGPEGSTGKLAATELAQRINDLCVDLTGADGMLCSGYEMTIPDTIFGTPTDDPVRALLRSMANTIEGGTSEVMRNILGERVLGLPGEPRVDRDQPWSSVPR